jgi:molybdopterin-guanine dinucleotide biosynthesis protein A
MKLNALILTGGKSSRMGQDKASLKIGGQTLLARALGLVSHFTHSLHLSIPHPKSGTDAVNTSALDIESWNIHLLPDLEPSPGPLGGLQAAFTHDPEAHWLVLAIDLPNLIHEELSRLVEAHLPSTDVTCFLNPLDGHPEPLCALYAPSARPALEKAITENRRCARKFLCTLKRTEIVPRDSQALLNLNRPEHLVELEHLNENGALEKEVTIEYFAKLSAEAGMNSETICTTTATLAGLWEEVRLRHHFTLDLPQIKPAVDDEFADWHTLLVSGHKIAFMPPFAGG